MAGNVRRTAEIAFGNFEDVDFMDLKNYKKNPHRISYGWASNNTGKLTELISYLYILIHRFSYRGKFLHLMERRITLVYANGSV